MTRIKDMTGLRFERLLVVSREGSDSRGESRWRCICDCGKEATVLGSHLRSGRVKSCGCYSREEKSIRMMGNNRKPNLRHGGSNTRLYKTWTNMKTRCFNSNSKCYQWYGGQGVTVCDEWLSFAAFQEWALSSGYDDTLTIERRNPFGNYEPTNCIWIPRNQQNRNKRSHPHYEID